MLCRFLITNERVFEFLEPHQPINPDNSSFLRHLSPLYQLPAAHKAMEWLVRRFRVQEYNVEAIIRCVLPYHDTKLFVRTIQILDIRQKPEWAWLIPLRKHGVPLPRAVLVRQAKADRVTLRFVCELVPDALSDPSPPPVTHSVSLFASVATGVLAGGVREDVVAALLPHVLGGVASTNDDLRAAAYLVVSQLAVTSTLQPDLIHTFLDAVGGTATDALMEEALLCMVLLCQAQTITALQGAAAQFVLGLDSLPKHLEAICGRYNAITFVEYVAAAMIGALDDEPQVLDRLLAVFDAVRLNNQAVVRIGKAALGRFRERRVTCHDAGDDFGPVQRQTGAILQKLERTYPIAMDALLSSAMSDETSALAAAAADGDGEDEGGEEAAATDGAGMLDDITELIGAVGRHQKVPGHLSMFLSLQHAEGAIRVAALRQLNRSLGQTTAGSFNDADVAFFRDVLEARMLDADSAVGRAAIELGAKLFDFIPPEGMLATLTELLRRHGVAKHAPKAFKRAVKLLAGPAFAGGKGGAGVELASQAVAAVLPHLLIKPNRVKCGVVALQVVAGSALSSGSPLLAKLSKVVSKEWSGETLAKDPTALLAANEAVFAHLAGNLLKDAGALAAVVAAVGEEAGAMDGGVDGGAAAPLLSASSPALRHAAWLLLTNAIARTKSSETRVALGHTLVGLLSRDMTYGAARRVHEPTDFAAVPADQLRTRIVTTTQTAANPEVSADVGFRLAVQHLVHLVQSLAPLGAKATKDGGAASPLSLATKIFVLVASCSNPRNCGGAMQAFFALLVPGNPLWFLAHCWCCGWSVPPMVRVRALHLATVFVRSVNVSGFAAERVPICSSLVPGLLYATSSDDQAVRAAAADAFANIAHLLSSLQQKRAATSKKGKAAMTPERLHWLASQLAKAKNDLVASPEAAARLVVTLVGGAAKADPQLEESVVCFLVAEALGSPYDGVCAAVLAAADGLTSVPKLKLLWPHVSKVDELFSVPEGVLRSTLLCVGKKTAPFFKASAARFDTLLALLSLDEGGGGGSDGPTPQALVLDRLEHSDFVAALPRTMRQQLFTALCNLLTSKGGHGISVQVRAILRDLQMEAEDIIVEMAARLESPAQTAPASSAKRARLAGAAAAVAAGGAADDDDTDDSMGSGDEEDDGEDDGVPVGADVQCIRQTAVILEVLQLKKPASVAKRSALLRPLFGLLERCLSLGAAAQPPLEHIKQMILDVLLQLCHDAAEVATMKEDFFNTELIVQCIKLSASPQTHHHALLLLAGIATIYPPKVLHAIMPIFTFMGTSMVKQDDNQTFFVIERTIKTVIPAIFNESADEEANLTTVISIIGVFVDALHHIPKHRSLPLFTFLLRTLGSDSYLHVVVALLLKRVVLDSRTKDTEESQQFPLAVVRLLVLDPLYFEPNPISLLSRPPVASPTHCNRVHRRAQRNH
jgi:U3 small nucleolar RNA-associated protein 10